MPARTCNDDVMSHHHDAHSHGDGHRHDQGLKGFLRYVRFLPSMWRSEVNDAVVAELAPTSSDRVVDIGAGMGSGVVPVARTGARVTAVEPTNYMRLVLNLRKMAQRGRKRIDVVDGAAEKLGVPDGSATAVMTVNAIHHWGDIELAAGEIARVLDHGGRILLVDERFDDPDHPEFDRHDVEHDHHFEAADVERTVAALTSAGLVDVRGTEESLAGVPVVTFRATKG